MVKEFGRTSFENSVDLVDVEFGHRRNVFEPRNDL